MTEKTQPVLTGWGEGEPMTYKCSLCGRPFLFPEDRSPKEGAAELWAAFQEHVQEEHSEEMAA